MPSYHARSTEHLSGLRGGQGAQPQKTGIWWKRRLLRPPRPRMRAVGPLRLLQPRFSTVSPSLTLLQPGSLLTFPQTCQAFSELRAFALAVPSS